MLLAANFLAPLFEPLVTAMSGVLTTIHHLIPSWGWSLVVLALVVRLALWPLSNMQFKSMAEMQKVAPLIKDLQKKYKNDPQGLQAEQMRIYKEHGVNPLAGCLPMLIPLPILFALFYAINGRLDDFHEPFLWIGSQLSYSVDHWHVPYLAPSLATMDYLMLVLYVGSMYFTVRFGSPPSQDPQQAQTQRIMAFMSPAIIAFMGFKYQWASALYVYWFALNVFTVAQQLWLFRRYGLIGPKAAFATAGGGSAAQKDVTASNGQSRKAIKAAADETGAAANNGKRAYRPKKRARR